MLSIGEASRNDAALYTVTSASFLQTDCPIRSFPVSIEQCCDAELCDRHDHGLNSAVRDEWTVQDTREPTGDIRFPARPFVGAEE